MMHSYSGKPKLTRNLHPQLEQLDGIIEGMTVTEADAKLVLSLPDSTLNCQIPVEAEPGIVHSYSPLFDCPEIVDQVKAPGDF
jgi:hypothetical protein